MFTNLAIVNGGPPLCIYVVASVYVLEKTSRRYNSGDCLLCFMFHTMVYIPCFKKNDCSTEKYFDRIMLGYIQGGAPLYS